MVAFTLFVIGEEEEDDDDEGTAANAFEVLLLTLMEYVSAVDCDRATEAEAEAARAAAPIFLVTRSIISLYNLVY